MYEFHGKILLSLTRMAGHSLLLGSLDLTEADSDGGDVAGVLRRGSRTLTPLTWISVAVLPLET